MTTLDEVFADVLHVKKPAVRKAAPPISPLAELQKSLDRLTGMGANRVDLSKPVVKSSAKSRRVRKTEILKQTEKRDYAFHSATGDESFATRSSREIGKGDNIIKAAEEDSIVLHGSLVSKGQITGEH